MPGTTEQTDGLIDRYLNNKLNDGERAAFEIMLLEDEQLFARVQLLDAFRSSLIDEQAALGARHEPRALPLRAWLQQPLSLAACVLVLGLGVQVGYDTISANEAAQRGGGIGTVLLVEGTRGASRLALSGAAPYLFQIDAGPDAANSLVAVALRDSTGDELLRVENLRVDANGWARVVFDQSLSGDYTLELVPATDAATIRTFDITLSN
jgi:hypothetical protein